MTKRLVFTVDRCACGPLDDSRFHSVEDIGGGRVTFLRYQCPDHTVRGKDRLNIMFPVSWPFPRYWIKLEVADG